MCWPDVSDALETDTPVILPLGSLEQHGPHLPFDTDTVCGQAVADGAAGLTRAISLPALSYGAPSRPRSGGGPVFPIGAEIGLGTYFDVVHSIMLNLIRRGVRNLLVLSWHTENSVVMYEAARQACAAASEVDAKVVALDAPTTFVSDETRKRAYVDGPVPGQFEHAGLIETSVMLALQPDRVREFADVEASLPALPYDVLPQPEGMVAPSGSFTSPANAAAEIGQMLLDETYAGLAKAIEKEFIEQR